MFQEDPKLTFLLCNEWAYEMTQSSGAEPAHNSRLSLTKSRPVLPLHTPIAWLLIYPQTQTLEAHLRLKALELQPLQDGYSKHKALMNKNKTGNPKAFSSLSLWHSTVRKLCLPARRQELTRYQPFPAPRHFDLGLLPLELWEMFLLLTGSKSMPCVKTTQTE